MARNGMCTGRALLANGLPNWALLYQSVAQSIGNLWTIKKCEELIFVARWIKADSVTNGRAAAWMSKSPGITVKSGLTQPNPQADSAFEPFINSEHQNQYYLQIVVNPGDSLLTFESLITWVRFTFTIQTPLPPGLLYPMWYPNRLARMITCFHLTRQISLDGQNNQS